MSLVSVVNALTRLVTMLRGRRAPSEPTERPTAKARAAATPRSAKPRPATAASPARAQSPEAGAPKAVGSDGGIPDLFRQRRSDVVVTASGRIVKILPDDLEDQDGSGRHQRWIVELLDRASTTILIAHNLKFGRVPARAGQIVTFRGEYEFSERGGTIHWTHHDPKGWHEDGWIELDGRRFG